MLNIGHRGASGHRPENTLEALSHALALGAHGVEFDIRQCGSGELVVIHDGLVHRTLEGKGRVSQLTLSQLKSMPVRGGGRLPELADALTALGKEPYCFIELKSPHAAKTTAALIQKHIEQGWQRDRLILIGFNLAALVNARQAYPDLCTGASFTHLTSAGIHRAARIHATYLIAQHESISPKHLELAHALGLRVIAWTVNDATAMQSLKNMGVDGIMTDYPERLTI